MKIGKLTIIGILLLIVCNSVGAVWIYPDVDMVANNFTLNTKSAQNYTSVTYGDTWIDLVEGGNITFARNCTSSRNLIELIGLCGIGNYTTDISIDVYAPNDWTVGSASVTCISNNSESDTPVTSYSTSTVNATHKRLTFTYNPSNDFDIIDMGFFDANISVRVSNDTLIYSGYNLTEDLFEVYYLASVGNITSSYNSTHNSINMSWDSIMYNTTTLRPNAVGDVTQLTGVQTPNWWNVDEVTPNTGDYVYGTNWDYDLYGLQNHTTETGDITNVTVFICCFSMSLTADQFKEKIKTNGVTSTGTVSHWASFTPCESFSYSWVVNPQTGIAWTWNEIDNLQAGVAIESGGTEGRCTQVYVVVDWYEYFVSPIAGADLFVVVRSNTSQPTCPTDGYEVQNNTNGFYNVSRTFTEAYFTVFTYNSTTRSYGTGVPMLWGGIQLQCFNESNPNQAINFDIEITNSDASEVYTANDVSNGQTISFDDIPYGDDTIFVISNSSYHQRIYYYNLITNHFYNYSFYLPPPETGPAGNTTDTELYLLIVVGPQNEYTSPPVEGVKITISYYNNVTDTYTTITSVLTDANGEADVHLIPFTLYKVTITKDGYDTEISNYIPSDIVFTKTFRITPSGTTSPEYDIFWDDITFTGEMFINGTIKATYSDNNESTINTQIYLYDVFNGSFTLINSNSKTGNNDYYYWVAGINASRDHELWLYFNNTANYASVTSPVVITVFAITWDSPITPTEFEARFTSQYGVLELGYFNVIAIIIPIILLCTFGMLNAGLGILTAGVSLGFIQAFFGLNVSAAFNPILALVCPIVIAIGFLYMLTVKPEEHI